ncbi:MAG TPA: sigma-70 family RNA polymerase sigma factor [Flavobacteriales bacterium]|nr:sigma-70 family RNA polymerase sigma factor [Flavobacteriales bacterium]
MGFFTAYKKWTDEQLMVAIGKNDYRAFDELHKRYNKRLLFFMLKMLNNDGQKAQDLLQDLFLKIVERPHLFNPEKKFISWVFTVAANMCRTVHRDAKNEISTEEPAFSEGYSNGDELIARFDAVAFQAELGRALDALPYEHKETFILRFQEGFSLQEISMMMNCSVGTVKSRIYYTTRKLAMDLEAFRPLLKKM